MDGMYIQVGLFGHIKAGWYYKREHRAGAFPAGNSQLSAEKLRQVFRNS